MRNIVVHSALLGAALQVFAGCQGDDEVTGAPGVAVVATIPASQAFSSIGAFTNFAAVARDAQGRTIEGRAVSWQTSDPAVATVDAAGRVVAVGNGVAVISATVEGRTGSSNVTVRQALNRITFASQPRDAVAGTALAPAIRVSLRDALGVALSQSGATVTLRLVGGPADAVLGGSVSAPLVSGEVTFDNVVITRASTGYRLIAMLGDSASPPSDSFAVRAAAVARLTFAQQPPAVAEGNVSFTPAVRVSAEDAFGNPVSSGSVALRLGRVPYQPAMLFGAPVAPLHGGSAEFVQLGIDRPGAGYTLIASAGGVSVESTPLDVRTELQMVDVGGTMFHEAGFACALTLHGTFCWGANDHGQLGNPDANSVESTPVLVRTARRFSTVSAGGSHACGLVRAGGGEAWCWGKGTNGQLGDGRARDSDIPVQVAGSGTGLQFAAISAGDSHTCGVLAVSGAVYCWGAYATGRLGIAVTADQTIPAHIPGSGAGAWQFSQVSAGQQNTCGVTKSFAIWCWGAGWGWALGNGPSTADVFSPVQVAGTGTLPLLFSQVSTGAGSNCAVTVGTGARRIYCWGDNAQGKLGNTATTRTWSPVQAMSTADFVLVSVAFNLACATDGSGRAHCWGSGQYGEMGNGTLVGNVTPGPVGGLTTLGFHTISVGTVHACGSVAGDGTYCWGYGAYGALGDGTNISRSVPVRVVQ
jgi:alpha-tubulin suppressor-like RCC1 family protein